MHSIVSRKCTVNQHKMIYHRSCELKSKLDLQRSPLGGKLKMGSQYLSFQVLNLSTGFCVQGELGFLTGARRRLAVSCLFRVRLYVMAPCCRERGTDEAAHQGQ